VRNLLLGLGAALLLAGLFTDAHPFGIALWKIALAALGLTLFALGNRRR
jgi:hypothetical protein